MITNSKLTVRDVLQFSPHLQGINPWHSPLKYSNNLEDIKESPNTQNSKVLGSLFSIFL